METTLYIKNMVCDRCIMAVENVLQEIQLPKVDVQLGIARIATQLTEQKKDDLRQRLKQLGFELLDDKRHQTIDRIKTLIIELVHYNDNASNERLSYYLSSRLGQDYSALSKLFSEFSGITIERYYILQRIERAKELLCYDELSLKQIALKMHYSSTAYLSSQFKSITGMTPSQFKAQKEHTRKGIDKL